MTRRCRVVAKFNTIYLIHILPSKVRCCASVSSPGTANSQWVFRYWRSVSSNPHIWHLQDLQRSLYNIEVTVNLLSYMGCSMTEDVAGYGLRRVFEEGGMCYWPHRALVFLFFSLWVWESSISLKGRDVQTESHLINISNPGLCRRTHYPGLDDIYFTDACLRLSFSKQKYPFFVVFCSL
jgi:hypothetical protein